MILSIIKGTCFHHPQWRHYPIYAYICSTIWLTVNNKYNSSHVFGIVFPPGNEIFGKHLYVHQDQIWQRGAQTFTHRIFFYTFCVLRREQHDKTTHYVLKHHKWITINNESNEANNRGVCFLPLFQWLTLRLQCLRRRAIHNEKTYSDMEDNRTWHVQYKGVQGELQKGTRQWP